MEEIALDARGTIIKVDVNLVKNIEYFKLCFNNEGFKKEYTIKLNFSSKTVHLFLDYLSGYNLDNNKLDKIYDIRNFCGDIKKITELELNIDDIKKIQLVLNYKKMLEFHKGIQFCDKVDYENSSLFLIYKEHDFNDVKKVHKFIHYLNSNYNVNCLYKLFDDDLINKGKSINMRVKNNIEEHKLGLLYYKQGYIAKIIFKLAYHLTKLSYDELYNVKKIKNNFISETINTIIECEKHAENIFYFYQIYFDLYSKYSPSESDIKVNIQLCNNNFSTFIKITKIER